MFKIIKTSTYKRMQAEIAVLKSNIESLQKTLDTDTISEMARLTAEVEEYHTRLQEAFTEHIKLVRENGELERTLHTLTAKKLPIKKSKNK